MSDEPVPPYPDGSVPPQFIHMPFADLPPGIKRRLLDAATPAMDAAEPVEPVTS